MNRPDLLQAQRFELKYLVSERTAVEVRKFVSSFLQLDPFGQDKPQLSYPIHSLYLDSPHLGLYWETINGNKNRFKLRLRYYDDLPGSPVFFEIKRRQNDAIIKQRGAVKREAVALVMAGALPSDDLLLLKEPKHVAALKQFVRLTKERGAMPKAQVSYLREAWVHPDNNGVRITIDRDVTCAPYASLALDTAPRRAIRVFGKFCVVELKYTGRFPLWFGELARAHGFRQCSAAKYVDGLTALGEAPFSPAAEARQRSLDQLLQPREFLT